MSTVCGLGRRLHRVAPVLRSAVDAPLPAPVPSGPARGGHLLTDQLGDQRRAGVLLDQADATTCGSAVLVALAAWADPVEVSRLDDGADGFEAAYDARQLQVHREATRWWPRALGTTPWGMAGWLNRHASRAGRYRVRLVDDDDPADVADAVAAVEAALAAGLPVPLLVGAWLPRHHVLARSLAQDGWRVYEPTSGQVRAVDPAAVTGHRLAGALGFDRLHAVLLPCSSNPALLLQTRFRTA